MIVFSVWGDHAFFYKDTLGAQTLKVGTVSSIPEVKLACRLDYERAPYRDMEEWEESCCQNSPSVAKSGNAPKGLPGSCCQNSLPVTKNDNSPKGML